MSHLLFVPIPTSQVGTIRPNDKTGLVRASRMNGPQWVAAIEAGVVVDGEVLNKALIRKSEFNPAGTHDSIRDGESCFSQWGFAYWRSEE